MPAIKSDRRCRDCEAEGITSLRKAPHPGPRCATHHRQVRKGRRTVSWEQRILATYNITGQQYWKLYEAQGGHCAFCPRTGTKKRLSIDHDHACCKGPTSCGKCVRGLLCSTCNSYLGHIRDRAEVGLMIHQYLVTPPASLILPGCLNPDAD